jgi:peptide/nickel transport system permease protein
MPLWIGMVMLITLILVTSLGPHFVTYDPLKVNMGERLEPVSEKHLLGTDQYGRDILSRMVHGAKYSLIVGVVSIGISTLLGSSFGIVAGYYSNTKFAGLIVWIADIAMAFPTIIIGVIIAMLFGPGLENTIMAIAVGFSPRFLRLARGVMLSIKEENYVVAARSLGMTDLRLFWAHLIPNVVSPIIIMATIWTSDAISLEVALSFLGLGVPPPTPSWGTILQDNLQFITIRPFSVIWPCIAVAWAIQSLNLIGDRFRDILDPKMR